MTRKNFLKVVTASSLTPLIATAKSSNEVSNSSTDLSRLLRCIAAVETSGNDSAVGSCGSRSQYQISHDVWFQYTNRPFKECRGFHATLVAEKHLMWLLKHGVRRAPYDLALAWHKGLWGYKHLLPTTAFNSFQQRVDNLYRDLSFK
jgi:hypothetical protein